MPSFSLDFPDDEISELLGDDIKVYNSGGGSQDVKGVFEHRYMEDELGDSIGIHYPTVEVDDELASLFIKKYRVVFNGTSYKVLNQVPGDVGKTLIILRS